MFDVRTFRWIAQVHRFHAMWLLCVCAPAWLPAQQVPPSQTPQVSVNPFVMGGPAGQPMVGYSAGPMSPADLTPVYVVDRLLVLAAKQEREGQPWQAIHTYRQALQLEPYNRSALLSYARMKHRAGDFDGAIILYGQILRYYPLDPVALNDLGLCFARKGDLKQAVDCLSKAVGQRPEEKRYRNNLAIVLVECGRDQEALQQMQAAQGPAVAHYNMATLVFRRGRPTEAQKHLEQAILHDPSFQPAMQLLATIQGDDTSERIASRDPRMPGDRIVEGSGAGRSVDPTSPSPGPSSLLIQPQSFEDSASFEDARHVTAAVAQPAIWQEPARIMPPRVEEYAIPGLAEFE